MESLSIMKFYLWAVLFGGIALLVGFQGTAGQLQVGRRKVTAEGRVFTTAFLQPVNIDIPLWSIVIPRTCPPSTSVSMSINNSDFKKDVKIENGAPATFEFPNLQQIIGSGTSSRSMIIAANNDITVISRNFLGTSGDVALMYPCDQWGNTYYVVTPIDEPSKNYAEFAVLASDLITRVTMVLGGSVLHNGKNYNKGDTITVTLEPFQSLHLQGKEDDLSGTEVSSEYPAAVLSGHSCVPGIGDCSHVYEQLLPEETWGKSYLVSVPSLLPCESQVYVLASKFTHLTCQSGEEKMKTNLEAGKVMKFKVSASKPLSIKSTEKIQVLLYGCGGNFEDKPYGSFLTKIPDIESFDYTYNLIGQKDFDNNFGVIVAKESSVSGFLFNGKLLQNARWKAFPDSDYVWSELNYGGGSSSNTLQNLFAPFGLLSIGYSDNMAYGTVAADMQDPECSLLDSIGIGVELGL